VGAPAGSRPIVYAPCATFVELTLQPHALN
jgi:hypothetical protein